MSYTEQGETYTHFTDEEDTLIKGWLKENGYTWAHNTVCGSCCGMYEDEYWVNGIGGEFKTADQKKFKAFAKKNGISCEVSGYTISALEED